MKSKNIAYLPWLDHLRFYGVILIVLYHGVQLIWYQQKYHEYFSRAHGLFSNNPLKTLVFEGHTAVALFMVVSGFVLTLGAYKKNISYFKFILNRILRIYPLFFAVAIFLSYYNYQHIDIFRLFQAMITLGQAKNAIYVPVSWAVAVEFQFYLIFPFFLVALNRRGIKSLAGFILFFIFLRLFSANGNFQYISYWTIFGRVDQFLIGMILGALYLDKKINLSEKTYPYLFLLSCLIIIFSLFVFNKLGSLPNNDWWRILWPDYEAAIWAVFILSYANIAKYVPKIISKIMESIGQVSYSMFLTHFIIILFLLKNNFLVMFDDEDLVWNAFLNTVMIVIPAVLAVSYIANFLIEKPFLKLRFKYKK